MNGNMLRQLEGQLMLKEFKLNSLLEITNAINSNKDVHQLSRLFEFILKEQLGYDKFVLFNKQDNWNCLLKVGYRGKVSDESLMSHLYRFREVTEIESSHSPVLNEFDVVIPVFHKGHALAYLLLSEKSFRDKRGHQYFSFVQTLTNIIVVAIENQRMTRQAIVQERFKKELEVASAMQKMLFPQELPTNKMMDISAKYKPRHEVGGDYYDFIRVGEHEYIICIADVSGKGISAAMLMANFQATIRTLFLYQSFDMERMIRELNKMVISSAKGEKFITFFVAHYNAETRDLYYVNAGHNHPFITNGKEVEPLDQGCIGLGMLDEIPFLNIGYKQLGPNTTLVLYTDGVVELENEREEFFGTERLIKLVNSYYPLNMDDMNSLIFSKLDEWKGPLDLVDDTAIFSCRFF